MGIDFSFILLHLTCKFSWVKTALHIMLPISSRLKIHCFPTTRRLLCALFLTLTLPVGPSATAQTNRVETEQPPLPAGRSCPAVVPGRLLMWFGEREFAPSAVLELRVLHVKDYQVIPRECVTNWVVSDPSTAHLDATTGQGGIHANAADGSVFTVSARVGSHTVSAVARVVDPVLHPLLGKWRQTHEIMCGKNQRQTAQAPIGELKFTGAGAFSLTRTPFESYVDYAGTYRFSANEHTLVLTILSGNRKPVVGTFKAMAQLTEVGELVVSQLPLLPVDSPRTGDAKACKMVYARH